MSFAKFRDNISIVHQQALVFNPFLPIALRLLIANSSAVVLQQKVGKAFTAGWIRSGQQNGNQLGRPATEAMPADMVRRLRRSGLSKS